MNCKRIILFILFLCVLFAAPALQTNDFLVWQEDIVEVCDYEEWGLYLAAFEATLPVSKAVLSRSCRFPAGPTLPVLIPPPKYFA